MLVIRPENSGNHAAIYTAFLVLFSQRSPTIPTGPSMVWCGNKNGYDALHFKSILHDSAKKNGFRVRDEFYCLSIGDWCANRIVFDHAILRRGKLYLIEFDDEDYSGIKHPRRAEKVRHCGTANIPIQIFYTRDLYGEDEDVEEMILEFLSARVIDKQDFIASDGCRDFVRNNLSWQMKKRFEQGYEVNC